MTAQPPIIAIVGRPNVGKSTLFNRYAGFRRALVHHAPGATRDRIAEEIEVGARRLLLVDTAGLDPAADSPLAAAVQQHAQQAVEAADAILFVVDGAAGLLPQDREIANALRRSRKPLLLAVNKTDTPAHAARALEFHALGIQPVHAISAEHGSGAWDALEALAAALSESPEAPEEPQAPQTQVEARAVGQGEADAPLRVALVGRPNVGKSSLLNRLAGGARALVSDLPGTTRDSIDIEIAKGGARFVFVDTAGLRRAGRREGAEHGSALLTVRAIERADVALVLMDAAEGMTEQDARVLSLARERGCACALIANKWDCIEQDDDPARARRVAREMERRMAGLADVPLLRISARTGKGVARLLPLARRLHRAASLRIPTAALNRWLREALRRHEPAMAARGTQRRPVRIFYAAQVAERPPTIVLFCSEPRAIRDSYRRFLVNQLRERFGLAGVPVRLRLRQRRA